MNESEDSDGRQPISIPASRRSSLYSSKSARSSVQSSDVNSRKSHQSMAIRRPHPKQHTVRSAAAAVQVTVPKHATSIIDISDDSSGASIGRTKQSSKSAKRKRTLSPPIKASRGRKYIHSESASESEDERDKKRRKMSSKGKGKAAITPRIKVAKTVKREAVVLVKGSDEEDWVEEEKGPIRITRLTSVDKLIHLSELPTYYPQKSGRYAYLVDLGDDKTLSDHPETSMDQYLRDAVSLISKNFIMLILLGYGLLGQ